MSLLAQLQTAEHVLTIPPIDGNGTSPTSTAIDTEGYGGVVVYFLTGNVAANMTALKITECETSGGTYTDVSGTDISSVGTLPLASGGDNKVSVFFVPVVGRRMRYLKVACTAGAGATVLASLAILVDPVKSLSSASDRGLVNSIAIA